MSGSTSERLEGRHPELLGELLRSVSRSFYLTLRVLPARVREPIGLAYLLARATDTVADTRLVPVDRRLSTLEGLRAWILGRRMEPVVFDEYWASQPDSSERRLLERLGGAMELLGAQEPQDRERIRTVLDTISGGQILDLQRFGQVPEGGMAALRSAEELDDYTYRVAGCVGEFWTRMCRVHVFPEAVLDDVRFVADGIRFGKGLQLVNILRDLPADLREGRCYLPEPELAGLGLRPVDLLDSTNDSRLRPVYHSWVMNARDHLHAGWEYTLAIPRRHVRVRLACAWPLLIGFETLKYLRTGRVLDPTRRIKVSRARVRSIVLRSVLTYPFPRVWDRQVPPGSMAPNLRRM